METLTLYEMQPIHVLMLSILVLYLGFFLNRKIRFLSDYYIPPAVTGGLICSVIVAVIYAAADLEIAFDMQIRDVLLLVFFSTIGLTAKLRTLASGGKALAILIAVAGVFLVFQNVTGVLLAMVFDAHPGYGLMGGSVSFAGGHGTSIAWGAEAEAAGLEQASVIGIAFATFGLIAGGLLGGPVARWLIERHRIEPDPSAGAALFGEEESADDGRAGELFNILTAILTLALCVALGDSVNRFLFDQGVLLPGFLTAMAVGIAITNLSDVFRYEIHPGTIDKFGEVALSIFLAMSLMSMQLWALATEVGPILVVLMAQMLLITLVVVFVVFRVMGRDYDACVISSGFVGLGLGATPVAIANMDALTMRFGPSPKAFLVVPLVGAFFIDILNALVIKFFVTLLPPV
ncbi:MAG: sodium/glutamate symporter [Kiloniellales bacterium]|nr:sodium/glutamate symporter [Kiloniellales bacterium]